MQPNLNVHRTGAIWSIAFLVIAACQLATSMLMAQEAHFGLKVVVLGIAQDAGYPQAGCEKDCCAEAWADKSLRKMVSCIGVVDERSGQRFLFDCTPDFPDQLRLLNHSVNGRISGGAIDGIFLTHAHIGHYTGLMHLGREVMGANEVPVYCMPRMASFLRSNGPWSQLVSLKNIKIQQLKANNPTELERFAVTPILVPHRDEFSETVGFRIDGPRNSVLYLPDIDKWSRWDQSIETVLRDVDVALLDGTFFANGEIPGRDMSLIPHPFVQETINRFSPLDESDRKKVKFIHFNHTNPALQSNSPAIQMIRRSGMSIAQEGEMIEL